MTHIEPIVCRISMFQMDLEKEKEKKTDVGPHVVHQ